MDEQKNYAKDSPTGMWGYQKDNPLTDSPPVKFDAFKIYPHRRIDSEEIKRLIFHYGMTWDAMSQTMREFCGLKHVTRDGYIRKSLMVNHDVQIEIEEEPN